MPDNQEREREREGEREQMAPNSQYHSSSQHILMGKYWPISETPIVARFCVDTWILLLNWSDLVIMKRQSRERHQL